MKVKKNIGFSRLPASEQAEFLGKERGGFCVKSLEVTELGCVIITYTYPHWDFESKVLITPILDSGYCQVIEID